MSATLWWLVITVATVAVIIGAGIRNQWPRCPYCAHRVKFGRMLHDRCLDAVADVLSRYS